MRAGGRECLLRTSGPRRDRRQLRHQPGDRRHRRDRDADRLRHRPRVVGTARRCARPPAVDRHPARAVDRRALVVVGTAPSTIVLLAGMVMVGVLAVVTQVLVAFAATVAGEHERGAVVGTVTSGVVIGILLARTFAGAITDVAGWRAVYLVSAALTLTVERAVVAVPAEPAPTSAADRLPTAAALDAHAVRDGTDAADPGRPGHADLRRLQRALDVAPPAAARAPALDVTRRDRVARPCRSGRRARCRAGRPARRSRSRPGHHRRGARAAVGVLAADRARAALAAGARRRSRDAGPRGPGRTRDEPEHDLQDRSGSTQPARRCVHGVLFDRQRRRRDRLDGRLRPRRLDGSVRVGRRDQRYGAGGVGERRASRSS